MTNAENPPTVKQQAELNLATWNRVLPLIRVLPLLRTQGGDAEFQGDMTDNDAQDGMTVDNGISGGTDIV